MRVIFDNKECVNVYIHKSTIDSTHWPLRHGKSTSQSTLSHVLFVCEIYYGFLLFAGEMFNIDINILIYFF